MKNMTWIMRLWFVCSIGVAFIMELLLAFPMLAGGHGPSISLRITLGPENIFWLVELAACLVGIARFRGAKLVSSTLCSICLVIWIAMVYSKWDILINWLGDPRVSASMIYWASVIVFRKSIIILLVVTDIRSLSIVNKN